MKKWTAFGGGIKTMSPEDLKRRDEELDAIHEERVERAKSVDAQDEQ
jgi:hypothetical protein